MTYTITVPIYRELPHIKGNIESINDWEHLFIIDNSPEKWCRQFEERGARVLYPDQNIGVARSWNEGIEQGADYTFFVSSSVKFNQGFSEVAEKLENLIEEKAPGIEYGVLTQLGWHCNALSQKTIEIIGMVDTNFYPSYVEDIDLCRRLYLAGIHPNMEGKTLGGTIPCVVIDAQPIEIATTLKRAGLQVHFNKLNQYYKDKWGGNKPNEKYDLPFGDKPLSYFPERSIAELKEKYDLD